MTSVIDIHPLTRVEGHGSIKVYLENGRVDRVELIFNESPRLFEALVLGKGFSEIPDIICRICSLCSTIHRVTALQAVERALKIEVSEVTRLYRELIVRGGEIQSHALHLYFLLLPDLMKTSGIAGLYQLAPEALQAGLAIKQAGNLVQETVGGRMIHPVNLALGGMGRILSRNELLALKESLGEVLPLGRKAVELFAPPLSSTALPKPYYLALDPAPLPLTQGTLCTPDGELCQVESYRQKILEETLPHSWAKRAEIAGKVPTVGALSRLNLGEPLSPLAEAALQGLKAEIIGGDIWWNQASQAVELVNSTERSIAIIDRILELSGENPGNVTVKPRKGSGVAATEAPRGTLIHGFSFDESGLCTSADVITPTSLNQGAMARDLLALAKSMDGADEKELHAALERLTRAYDPCISCSVHIFSR